MLLAPRLTADSFPEPAQTRFLASPSIIMACLRRLYFRRPPRTGSHSDTLDECPSHGEPRSHTGSHGNIFVESSEYEEPRWKPLSLSLNSQSNSTTQSRRWEGRLSILPSSAWKHKRDVQYAAGAGFTPVFVGPHTEPSFPTLNTKPSHQTPDSPMLPSTCVCSPDTPPCFPARWSVSGENLPRMTKHTIMKSQDSLIHPQRSGDPSSGRPAMPV